MKTLIYAAVFCLLCFSLSTAQYSQPKVQVYNRYPGVFGNPNSLICHVSNFHPPQISIELLKNDQEIPGAKQTNLAFEENWHYHLTKHVPFTPRKEDRFACKVTHMGESKIHIWEPDM